MIRASPLATPFTICNPALSGVVLPRQENPFWSKSKLIHFASFRKLGVKCVVLSVEQLWCIICVRTNPGWTQQTFTLGRVNLWSIINASVKPRTAYLLVQYDRFPGRATIPSTEETFTIQAAFSALRTGRKIFVQLITPHKFTSMTNSRSSHSLASILFAATTPALLNRILTRPHFETISSATLWISSLFLTSILCKLTLSAYSPSSAPALHRRSSEMSQIATLPHPLSRRHLEISKPIPAAPPVTTALDP
mmetsp:Transcript_3797/g.5514  ORF Transcript_3797/g.5514 Transcript_3797/m.5514 type:complete len:251 (+) Transcript_3797:325-1077(+)